MSLEELRRGMLVEGVSPYGAVTLRDVESDGDGTVEVIFKDASGRTTLSTLPPDPTTDS